MRLLLDTHAIIWFYQIDLQLSAKALAAIQDPQNELLVSPVSYWEIAIKSSRYKSVLQVPFDVFIQEADHFADRAETCRYRRDTPVSPQRSFRPHADCAGVG